MRGSHRHNRSGLLPATGLLTFAPGQTSQQGVVSILCDNIDEPTETVSLNIVPTLSNPLSAAFADYFWRADLTINSAFGAGTPLATGTGSILSDDGWRVGQCLDCTIT